jgi:hypothetical protein
VNTRIGATAKRAWGTTHKIRIRATCYKAEIKEGRNQRRGWGSRCHRSTQRQATQR